MDFGRLKDILKHDTETVMVATEVKKPGKIRSILGLIFSVIFLLFMILIFGFQFKVFYFLVLFIDLLLIAYFGINLFTDKGIGFIKYKEIKKSELENNEEEVEVEEQEEEEE